MKNLFIFVFLCFTLNACKSQENDSIIIPPDEEFPQDFTAIIDNNDPFKNYLYSLPDKITTLSTNSTYNIIPTTTEKFVFKSKDDINTVYSVLSYPQQKGKYPTILILHGGGGNAEGLLGEVEAFAKQGYVAMALDLPGLCGFDNTPNSSGPWKARTNGETPRFEVGEDPKNNTLFDALIAAIEGFNLLTSRDNVDKLNLGITGYSWGGYTTTMLSGLTRDRVKAAYSVYGSGYYDKQSFWTKIISDLPQATRETWLKYYDAGRRAAFITAPFFMEAAVNDTYFGPESVMETFNAMPGAKKLYWGANLNHKRIEGAENMKKSYFDYFLKNKGKAPIAISILNDEKQVDGSHKITANIGAASLSEIKSVKLVYSEPNTDWTQKKWIEIDAENINGIYTAILPKTVIEKNVSYYLQLIDKTNVQTSSLIVTPL